MAPQGVENIKFIVMIITQERVMMSQQGNNEK
jgi:hypothetical protein